MKKIVMIFMSVNFFSLYAAHEAPKKKTAYHYDIRYEKETFQGKTGFYYILYGTQGISKGIRLAYTDSFAKLIATFELSTEQLEQLEQSEHAARIRDQESVNKRLADDSKNLAPLRETASKISTTKD